MTPPAEQLTAAADLLQPLAEKAQHDLETADYWACYDKTTAWRDGFVNGFGGISSDLVAYFTPAFTAELVRLFRAEARRLALPGPRDPASPHVLTLARTILQGAPSR
ncbi:hypothetical protein ACIGMX_34750 [Streptomyces aquilus]|uniref:hypothetical protein n=1 Tax=Streptomyces aquilus TaxID=2548456 RepID=UPI0037CE6168